MSAKLGSTVKPERGQTLIAYLIFVLLTSVLIATALNSSSSFLKSTRAANVTLDRQYTTEESVGEVTTWLREHSTDMLSPFSSAQFYSNFSKTAPAVGSNDLQFGVPTKVKAVGSSNSIILSNDASVATSYFPATVNIVSGVAYDPVADFQSKNFSGIVKVTLVDAIADMPAKDFGPPPNPAPGTAFKPVYRIDVMSEQNAGTAMTSYLTSELVYANGGGFYAEDLFDFKDAICDSYNSASGSYGPSNKTPNCLVQSNKHIKIMDGTTIYGSAESNKLLQFGGSGAVCANFVSGCPTPGYTCNGASCNVPAVAQLDDWNILCPTNKGSVVIASNTTLTVASSSANDRCWKKVTVNKNITLTLSSSQYGYYFETLELKSGAKVVVNPVPAAGTVTLYFDELDPGTITGKIFLNNAPKPSQFQVYYAGKKKLTLEDKSDISMSLHSMDANVDLDDKFNFFGVIAAKQIKVEDANLHFDESTSSSSLLDVNFRPRGLSQYYR